MSLDKKFFLGYLLSILTLPLWVVIRFGNVGMSYKREKAAYIWLSEIESRIKKGERFRVLVTEFTVNIVINDVVFKIWIENVPYASNRYGLSATDGFKQLRSDDQVHPSFFLFLKLRKVAKLVKNTEQDFYKDIDDALTRGHLEHADHQVKRCVLLEADMTEEFTMNEMREL